MIRVVLACFLSLLVTAALAQAPAPAPATPAGCGSVLRHSHLFAVFSVTMLDGQSYERINRPFAGFGARLAQGLRITEDPLNKLDNEQFPEPPAAATGSAILRERTRELVAARLDQALPGYFKRD